MSSRHLVAGGGSRESIVCLWSSRGRLLYLHPSQPFHHGEVGLFYPIPYCGIATRISMSRCHDVLALYLLYGGHVLLEGQIVDLKLAMGVYAQLAGLTNREIHHPKWVQEVHGADRSACFWIPNTDINVLPVVGKSRQHLTRRTRTLLSTIRPELFTTSQQPIIVSDNIK